jgi:hypothetical protein
MRKLAFLYLCLAMTCLTLLRCSLDPLDMPSWDVEINLPVLTETYTLSDLAEDEDAVKVLGDSLYVEVTKQLTEVDLTGRFDFSPYRGGFGARIGAFEVKTIQPAGTYFTIGDLWGDAGAFSGRVEVPPFCFPGPGEPVASGAIYLGDDFAWAQVESGIVDVAVENNLEVPLGDPAGGCPLVLRVSWYGGEWDSVVFDEPVPPGGVSEVEVSLAGRMIANSIGLKMRGGSPGSDDRYRGGPAGHQRKPRAGESPPATLRIAAPHHYRGFDQGGAGGHSKRSAGPGSVQQSSGRPVG